jgi:DNA ligase (NAD+)
LQGICAGEHYYEPVARQGASDQDYNSNLLKDVSDFFNLKKEDLLKLERFAEKSADNLIESIETCKQTPFERVLFALGIRYVGETVAKKLAKSMGSIEKIMSASMEELLEIDEIGEKIAQSIHIHFASEKNKNIVHQLIDSGVQMEMGVVDQGVSEKLKGKSLIISGVFKQFSRDELKNMIELNGGKNVSSISSKTDYLVAGENIGPSKLEKAQKLNIPIISEAEFLDLIE